MKIFKPLDLEKMDKAYHSEPDNRHDCLNGMTLPSWHWTCDGDKDCPDGDLVELRLRFAFGFVGALVLVVLAVLVLFALRRLA